MEKIESFYDFKDEQHLFSFLPSNIIINKIKKELGSGSEGVIYEYDSNKILKLNLDPRIEKNNFFKICQEIKNNDYSFIMKIHDYGSFYNDNFFWYIAEKLQPLKEYELLELEYNCDSYHKFVTEKKSFKPVKTKTNRVNNFWKFLSSFTYGHVDLWYANVMRDESLNIKVIDVEGFEQCQ